MIDRARPPAKRVTPRDLRRADLKERAKTVAWGLAVYAACCFAAALFASQKTASAGVQAAIVEWSTGRLGIAWSDPHAKVPTIAAIAKRALRGAGLGVSTALALLALGLATHAAKRPSGDLSIGVTAIGLISPMVLAVRDELLLRGLVLRVLSTAPRAAQLAACGLSSIAAALGASDANQVGLTAAQIAVAGLSGVAFGALWQRDRGAWMAWGAHAAWLFGVRTIDVNFGVASTSWGGGDAGLDGGLVALPVLAVAAGAACFWAFRASKNAELTAA